MKARWIVSALLLISCPILFAAPFPALDNSTEQSMSMQAQPSKEQIGPWTLMCVASSLQSNLPNAMTTQTKAQNVKMCTAQQHVTHPLTNNTAYATINLSPILISILVKNVNTNAGYLTVGDNTNVKLNVFCSHIAKQSNCFFTPTKTEDNKTAMALMAQNSGMTLHFNDSQTKQSVSIPFNLEHFDSIYQLMQHSEQAIKQALEPAQPADQSSAEK